MMINGYNVSKTIIDHPPVITINRWYKLFPNGWLVTVFTNIGDNYDNPGSELGVASSQTKPSNTAMEN